MRTTQTDEEKKSNLRKQRKMSELLKRSVNENNIKDTCVSCGKKITDKERTKRYLERGNYCRKCLSLLNDLNKAKEKKDKKGVKKILKLLPNYTNLNFNLLTK